jgi:cytochrome c biogenesis protein CcmG, thiol:disulfide interchange protein DsbE
MTEASPPNAPGKPSPILIIFLIFPLMGIIAGIALALNESSGSSSTVSTPLPVTLANTSLIDKAAPNFQLTGLDGKDYYLSSYRGRIVFVNFWATWCVPCQTELPALQQFQAQQGADGAVILAVNQSEPPDKVTEYLDQHSISGLTVLMDANLDVNTAFNIQALPTTFVIDAAGIVRYKHLGEMKTDDIAAYMSKLESS